MRRKSHVRFGGRGELQGSSLPLREDVPALEHKLTHGTNSAEEVTSTGANLRILNGLQATETTNGLGNLLVGDNELRGATDVRTGSHHSIVGVQHNCTSFGGLVVGHAHAMRGQYAVVRGGTL